MEIRRSETIVLTTDWRHWCILNSEVSFICIGRVYGDGGDGDIP